MIKPLIPILVMIAIVCTLVTAADEDEYQLLHFSASWCGPCVPLAENLKHKDVVAAMKKHRVKLVDIDFDEETAAVAKYKVTALPTCILVKVNAKNEAVVIRRKTGTLTTTQLVELVQPAKSTE